MKKIYRVFVCLIGLFAFNHVHAQCSAPLTVPYTENFNSITANNQLPACWAISGPACLTYTSSTPAQGYAAFNYTPAGVNYFYTPGVQLYPGITYSLSLAYRVDPNAVNNWSDLSVLGGIAQASANLVALVSTNASVTSTSFAALTGTFTVPLAATIYFAIRATGSNASSQLLYVDNFAVTIPCSLNSPTLTAVASSGTVCSGQPVTFTVSGASTYTWPAGSHNPVYTDTPTIPSGNITATVFYHVSGTNTLSACTASTSGTVTVYSIPDIGASSSDANNQACSGSTIILHASGVATGYTWSPGSSHSANPVVTPTANTVYTIQANNSNTCMGTATIGITVNPSPTVTAASSNPTLCTGSAATITASGADSYLWQIQFSNTPVTTASVAISPTVQTSYTLTGTSQDNGCSAKIVSTQYVDACAGIKVLSATSSAAVYPNPGTGLFHLLFSESSVTTIEVSDLGGRLIISRAAEAKYAELDLSPFANGLYYLRLSSPQKTGVIKLIKE